MIEAVSFVFLFMIFTLRKLLWCCTVAWLQPCFACSHSAVHMFCGGSGAKSQFKLGRLLHFCAGYLRKPPASRKPTQHNQDTTQNQHKKACACSSAPLILDLGKSAPKRCIQRNLGTKMSLPLTFWITTNEISAVCDVMTSDRQIFQIFFVIIHPISLLVMPIAFESVLASALRPPLAVSEEQITCQVNAP